MRARRASFLVAGLIVASTRSAEAAGETSRKSDKAEGEERGPKIPVLKETEPSKPSGNPWEESGLSKKKGNPWSTSDAHPFSFGLFGGYASDHLQWGFGGRFGYTVLDHLYLGAAFAYQLAFDGNLPVFYPSLEIGYDAHIGPVTIRPHIAPAIVFAKGTEIQIGSDGPTTKDSFATNFGFYPGLQIDCMIPDTPGFIGFDGRSLLIVGNGDLSASAAIFLTLGARF